MVKPTAVLILGHGTIGSLVARRLTAHGVRHLGVRRSQPTALGGWIQGDFSQDSTWDAIERAAASQGMPWPLQAVLLCANPGLRRGRDNRLLAGVELVRVKAPDTRLVYTGTTAVYANAAGGAVDEGGSTAGADAAQRGLLAIEEAVLELPAGLVLRAPALVGPSRTHALERLRSGAGMVAGDLQRPFSYLHEEDLADICVDALLGGLGTGILNAASPKRIRLADYYQDLARRAGVPMPVGDDQPMASRWIDASRLWSHYPARRWRSYATCG
jgi:nucleoside-diphosphate-sugar epimerase